MPRLPRVFALRSLRSSLRPGVLGSLILPAALVTLATLICAGGLFSQEQQASPRIANPRLLQRHASAQPLIAGTGGTQTGTANFTGNFTVISAPSSQVLGLARETNCSLTLLTGNYTLSSSSSLSYTRTGLTSNYDRILHSEGGVASTAGVYAGGCKAPTTGIGSRAGVFVGTTTTGINVFAAIYYSIATMDNGLYIMSGTDATTYSMAVSSFSAAGFLTASDLNNDGNGDLVVVNSPVATSSSVTVLLGNTNGTFQQGVVYPTAGNYTIAAVIDDVNGDGNPDIVAISNDQQISVLLGNGDGAFQAAKSFAAPALPGYSGAAPIINMITADLRNNGKKDIICSNGLVLLGNGDGTFTAAATPAFPYFIDSLSPQGPNLASGDLNNDGKIDLVLDNGLSISTWLGNGDGTFTQGISYATINDANFVTVSDLDGDGNNDIYIGLANGGAYEGDNYDNNLAYALMGDGNASFQGAPVLGFGAYTGNNLADVTGSGTLDLITNTVDTPYGEPNTTVPTFTVQLGTGKGTFAPTSTITAPASFVLNGTTVTSANTAAASTYAVGDVNGDGKADLVFADNDLYGGGSLTGLPVYFTAISNGDGTFQAPVPNAFPQIAPAGDFDNGLTVSGMQITNFKKGGPAGLIFSFNETAGQGTGGPPVNPYKQGILVLPGNGNGTYGTPVIITTLSSTTAINTNFSPVIAGIADLNGDGNPDLVVINNSFVLPAGAQSQVEIFLGNGDGTFKTPTTVTTPANPTAVVIADFNNDGKPDIAVLCGAINANVDQIAISLGNGDGTFTSASTLTVGSDINGGATIAAADFNGDGNVDLALINYYGYSGLFFGNGAGTFTSVNTGSYVVPQDLLNLQVSGPAVAVDLNKDGKPDLLVGNTILLNQAAPSVGATTTPTVTVTPNPSSITIAQSTMVTVAVSGSGATPTGSVTLSSGAYTSAATALTSGSAVITVPGSALAVATDTLTATYTPDSASSTIYTTATGTNSVTVTTAPVATFGLTNGGNINVEASATTGNTSAITVTPSNGFTGAVSLSCAVTTTPTNPISPATCGVTPTVTITGASAQNGTLTITTTQTTTAGAYAVTVTGVSGGITQMTTVDVTVTAYVPPTSFALTNSGIVSITAPGATTGNTATITVTPSGGFTGAVALTAAIATSPTGAADLPTFSFGATTPVTITGAAAATGTLTITTTPVTTGALSPPDSRGLPWTAAGGAMFAGVLLIGIRARRRRWLSLLGMFALLAFVVGAIMSCGGGGGGSGSGGNNGNPGTTLGNYTITVTGASGSITETTTVNLTVN